MAQKLFDQNPPGLPERLNLAMLTYGRSGVQHYVDVPVFGGLGDGKTQFIRTAMKALKVSALNQTTNPALAGSLSPQEIEFQADILRAVEGTRPADPLANPTIKHYLCKWEPRSWPGRFQLLQPRLWRECVLFLAFSAVALSMSVGILPHEALSVTFGALLAAFLVWVGFTFHAWYTVPEHIELVFWDVPGEWIYKEDRRESAEASRVDRTDEASGGDGGATRSENPAADVEGGAPLASFFAALVARRRSVHRGAYALAPVVICNPLKIEGSPRSRVEEAKEALHATRFGDVFDWSIERAVQLKARTRLLVVMNYRRAVEHFLQDAAQLAHRIRVRAGHTLGYFDPVLVHHLPAFVRDHTGRSGSLVRWFEYDAAVLRDPPDVSGVAVDEEVNLDYAHARALAVEDGDLLLKWLEPAAWVPGSLVRRRPPSANEVDEAPSGEERAVERPGGIVQVE